MYSRGFIGCINPIELPGLPCWERFGANACQRNEVGRVGWNRDPEPQRGMDLRVVIASEVPLQTGSFDVHVQHILARTPPRTPTQRPSPGVGGEGAEEEEGGILLN